MTNENTEKNGKFNFNVNRPSSISLAHQVLYQKQEEKQSWLSRKDLELVLQTTPGIIFAPGTTFDDVIKKLEKYDFIKSDKLKNGELRYFVLSEGWY